MIIENLDALKTWLSETLEPICDADPSALAKYVVALVKKDKTEKELKALCIDQLDVFLQKETQLFVDKLFEAINNKCYLPQSEVPASVSKVEKEEQKKEETNREEDREKKFSRRVTHSPPQSSSRHSRDNRRGDDRKRDDRPRKRDYDRIPPRRDSYRDRYNRRRGRSRSYSRSRSRSWSKDRNRDRDRERDRDRGDRDRSRTRSHSRTRSRSRSRERDSGKLKYDHERGERSEVGDGYTTAVQISTATTSHFPVPTLSSTITVIAPSHHHSNSATESWSDFCPDPHPLDHGPFSRGPPPQQRKRCRDYDEKGFCMRGDMCPFDHGSDPVVVEDVSLPNMLPFQPPPIPGVEQLPPPGLPPPPPLMNPPPVNLRPPVPPPGALPPSLPPVAGPPPPLPPLQPPSMDVPLNSITNSVPTIVTSGMRPSLPQPSAPLFPSDNYEADVYNPEAPSITNTSRPIYRHRVNAQRPNLIGLTMGEIDKPQRDKIPNNCMRIVMESDPRKRPAVSHDGGLPAKKPWFDKPNFNKPNHQGFHKRVPFFANTKLLVRQIPPELNNISKLNEHFSKFGTIVNLQVAYQNNPEAALIQFATPDEARRAIQSIEAVLNNRFIRVHWFREDDNEVQGQSRLQQQSQPALPSAASLKQSVKDRLGPMLPADSESSQDSSTAGAAQNTSKVPVKDRLGFSPKPAAPVEKVYSTSLGLTKTVYNPVALKAAQKTSEEALKKKQEALKLQHDVRKKKQEILEKHIETQKLLISKLEKNKIQKDKATIMETLDTLTKSITKLQEEIKGISSNSNNPLRAAKSKAQAQKELLDAELDLYKKTQSGEDTALLKIKYTQLQIEAAKKGLLSTGRGRGVHARGRGSLRARGRGSRGRGRGVPLHSVVDHRPRALEISGFTEEDCVDLLPHFAQYGEIEDCQIDENNRSAVITYRTRAEAEQAAIRGVRFNNQVLHLAWHKPISTHSTADADEAETEENEYPDESLSDDALLQDDDEEDDDNEPRSWRR
ncbi:RNA-binding 26 isoform X1 [Solea senegalensis]|uniref:RNA-binding 26 isoform X1 n=1 Tax=Solea senegalensis TaxID=28829 RepID=A0AAV6Q485_SOLSE|nr:RNA-binding protein 26 [Solea senegalensis]KAG7482698.1 RNA-binding 26 isoform X1 [Solea senegalensis]